MEPGKYWYRYGEDTRLMSPATVELLGGKASGWKKLSVAETKKFLEEHDKEQALSVPAGQDAIDAQARRSNTQQVKINPVKTPEANAPAEIEEGADQAAVDKANQKNAIRDPFDTDNEQNDDEDTTVNDGQGKDDGQDQTSNDSDDGEGDSTNEADDNDDEDIKGNEPNGDALDSAQLQKDPAIDLTKNPNSPSTKAKVSGKKQAKSVTLEDAKSGTGQKS